MAMMLPALEQLWVFFAKGEVGPAIRPAMAILGKERLRVVAIQLFSWIASQQRTGSKRPLALSDTAQWSQDIRDFLSAATEIGKTFVLAKENEIDFAQEMPEEARSEIRRFVGDNYRPRLFSDPKRPRL
jgi:hypothetical protein